MANQFQGIIRFFLIGSLVTVFLLTKIDTFTLCFKVRPSAEPRPVPPGPSATATMQLPFPCQPSLTPPDQKQQGPLTYPAWGRLLAAPHIELLHHCQSWETRKASWHWSTAHLDQSLSLQSACLGMGTEPLWASTSSSVKWR